MFTPLTPAQMITAIGATARQAARRQEPPDDFSQGQLKAAYSAARHLAIELEAFGPALGDFSVRISAATQRAGAAAGDDAAALDALAARLARTRDATHAGEAVCELLELCRAHPGAAWAELRSEVHRALAMPCDSEVDALDAGLERAG